MKRGHVLSSRPPSYVSCATLAKELDMSETSVREYVDKGVLPKPVKLSNGCVRWVWSHVELALGGIAEVGTSTTIDPYMVGAVNATTTRKS